RKAGEVGPERTIGLSTFALLGQRVALGAEAERDAISTELQLSGFSNDEAESLAGYITNGGRSITAQLATSSSGSGPTLDEEVWFGREDSWWHAEESGHDVLLQAASRSVAVRSLRAMVDRGQEASR